MTASPIRDMLRHMDKTAAKRQRAYRNRQSIRGKVLKQIWVTASKWEAIQRAIAKIQGEEK